MNKSELVEQLAERSKNQKLTKKKAEAIVNTIFKSMSDALIQNNRIEIRGFGSFQLKTYDAYIGRNPRTGATIEVPAKKLPFFKVGKELKEKVDGRNGKHNGEVSAPSLVRRASGKRAKNGL